MPSYQTTGIVIGRTNFGEADRVVRFLTAEHGKISAVAKGVRRIKSRAAGHLELFGEVNLMLANGRNLDVVTSARLVWYPHELVAAYERLGLAFAMATAIDRLTEPGQAHPQLYTVLREGLRAVDAGASGALPELWFKLRLLETLGYRPELAACIVCGRRDPGTTYVFDPARGGLACAADAEPGAQPFSHAAIKFWRLLTDYPYATVHQITDAPTLAADTLPLCDAFYEHHLGRAFRPIIE
ncbi:MAG: recO [Patescibacteria group bacterium]|nr:recO [Patescibacteria group bacterium]